MGGGRRVVTYIIVVVVGVRVGVIVDVVAAP